MASIELEEITKRYSDGTEAVTEVSLDVPDGEVMVIVGPSGCGKSTALRMVAGLEDISDGELRIGGERVNELPPSDRDVAMVFQNYALYPHMTVRRNMGFALKIARADKAEIDRNVEEAARMLDLTPHLDRKPAMLSGGQRQRVAMGRAIVRSPQAFLMDEPLSNLDAKLRVQMRTSVAQLQRRLGTTTLYVTHDQTEAMTLGDRIAVMRKGVLQQVDTPERVYDDPANVFVAGFIGSPAINLLPGRIENDSIELPFGTIPLPTAGDLVPAVARDDRSRDVVVGIRPEHFEDAAFANGHTGHLTFSTRADVVESMGSERYAYFTVGASSEQQQAIEELVGQDATREGLSLGASLHGGGLQVAARVHGASQVSAGEEVELALDASNVKLFEHGTGRALLER